MAKGISFGEAIEEVTAARYADDRTVPSIKGVRGLTKAECDTIVLYLNTCMIYGDITSLMEPRGKVKEVLDRYGVDCKRESLYRGL